MSKSAIVIITTLSLCVWFPFASARLSSHTELEFKQEPLKLQQRNGEFLDLPSHGRQLLGAVQDADLAFLLLPLENGSWLNISLSKNGNLISEAFSESILYSTGEIKPREAEVNVLDCHYYGRFTLDGKIYPRNLAVSICHEITGIILVEGSSYKVDYYFNEGITTVRKLEEEESDPIDFIVKPHPKLMTPPITSSIASITPSAQQSSLGPALYIELLIVSDVERVLQFNDLTELTSNTLSVLNQVGLFFNTTVFDVSTITLVVAGMVHADAAFLEVPEVNGEHDASALLSNITDWRTAHLDSLPAHDTVHLFSGKEFKGATIGLAYMDSICDQTSACDVVPPGYCYQPSGGGDLSCCVRWSAAISEVDANNVESFDAATVAHEIGHQLGFPHDGTDVASLCPSSGFIMSASSVSNADQTDATWSSCTAKVFQDNYAGSTDTNGYHAYGCLTDIRYPVSSAPDPINAASERQLAVAAGSCLALLLSFII